MKSRFIVSLTVAALLGLTSVPASAVNLGFNVGLGQSTMDYELNTGFGWVSGEAEMDHTQVGFTMDLGKTGRLFQYRLHAGYQQLEYESFNASDSGIGFDNHFGFVFNSRAPVRIWAGPSVYLGQMDGDSGSGSYFGIGPTVGVDVPLESGPKLGFEISYRITARSHYDDTWDDISDSNGFVLRGVMMF